MNSPVGCTRGAHVYGLPASQPASQPAGQSRVLPQQVAMSVRGHPRELLEQDGEEMPHLLGHREVALEDGQSALLDRVEVAEHDGSHQLIRETAARATVGGPWFVARRWSLVRGAVDVPGGACSWRATLGNRISPSPPRSRRAWPSSMTRTARLVGHASNTGWRSRLYRSGVLGFGEQGAKLGRREVARVPPSSPACDEPGVKQSPQVRAGRGW
jgi:hypothetical protein